MQPTNNLKTIINKIARFVPLLTAFLVPIFFLPFTTEFFSFNKLALIVFVTLFLIVIWGLKIMTGDKIEIAKSPVDRSLLALSVVAILAAIFSVSKADSIYGSPGRWLGLFAFLAFVAFFYIATPLLKGIKTIKNSLFALLIGSTISSVIAILSYYNITLGKADFLRNYFTLTGSVNDSILLAALAVTLAFSFILSEKDLGKRLMLINLVMINFFFVAITGKPVGWVIVIVGLVLSALYNRSIIMQRKSELGALGLIMALMLALVLVPTTKRFIVNPNFRSDLALSLKETWAVSTSTIRDFPLLATGPGTFYINFARYRPLILNNSPFWNIQFNLPFNGVFEALTTLGIIVSFWAVIYCQCLEVIGITTVV
ncbi:O-antigen ligase family protein [Patescibacteria group bacterium]